MIRDWVAPSLPAAGAEGAGPIIIFLVGLAFFLAVGHGMAARLAGGTPGAFGRLLGVVFGVARGGFLVGYAYLQVSAVVPPDAPMLREARTLPLIEQAAGIVRRLNLPGPGPAALPSQPTPGFPGTAPILGPAPGPNPGARPRLHPRPRRFRASDELLMNPADIFVIVIVVLSALVGLMRGFIREVLSVVSWVGAAFVTFYSFEQSRALARDLLKSMVDNPTVHDVAGATVVFVVSLSNFSVISHFIASLVTGGVLGAIIRSVRLPVRRRAVCCWSHLPISRSTGGCRRPSSRRGSATRARCLRSSGPPTSCASFAPDAWRRNRPQQPQPAEDDTVRRARLAQEALRALSVPAAGSRPAVRRRKRV